MISNCITHNRRFPLSYVSDLNVISTSYINIFKQLHHKNHHAPRASFLLLQITPAIIYPVTLACNSFHISPSRPTISNTVTWIMYLKFIHSMGQISWEANRVSAGQEFFHFSKSKFHCHLHKTRHLSLYWTHLHDFSQKWRYFLQWWEQNTMLSLTL